MAQRREGQSDEKAKGEEGVIERTNRQDMVVFERNLIVHSTREREREREREEEEEEEEESKRERDGER